LRKNLGQGQAVAVLERQSLLRRERSRGQLRPCAGDAEAGALLVGEVRDDDRSGRCHSPGLQAVERGERRHHAQRSVEGSPVRDGVEVGAEQQRIRTVVGPGQLVAVAVLDDVHAAGLCLGDEPLAELEIRVGPRVSAVTTGPGVEADVGDGVEPFREAQGPVPSRMGTRTPRSSATSAASS
jgi:hypothetical protein